MDSPGALLQFLYLAEDYKETYMVVYLSPYPVYKCIYDIAHDRGNTEMF